MTTRNSRFLKLAATIAASVCLLTSAQAQNEIIYNNTTVPLNSTYTSNLEFGDEITFAGQNRQVTRISFEYAATVTPDPLKFGLMRIYANDGPAGAPGTTLYASPVFQLVNGSGSIELRDFNPFVVPETVTWTLTFGGLGAGESAGALLYDPPTIGTSDNDFWQKDALGAWNRTVLTPLAANFSARITAVPEPGTVSLLVAGGLLLGGAMMRRRKSA